MKPVRFLFVAAAAALAFAALPSSAEENKIVKTFPFSDKETKVNITVGDVVIGSFRIRNWPEPDEMAKGEKNLKDTHKASVEFTYANRDTENNYKCHYTIEIPGGADGRPYALTNETRTLSKGKADDTNKVSLRMKTHEYKLAKTMKVTFEIWKKT
jgi:hypothetical protein